jgi:hypothetical protein
MSSTRSEDGSPVILLYRRMKEDRRVAYVSSDRSEVSVRCPYCGDSHKDRSHAHFYINTVAPFFFYCQRCETGGVLNSTVAEDIGCHDDAIGSELDKQVKKALRDRTVRSTDVSGLVIPPWKYPKYDLSGSFGWRLDYMVDRLGFDIDRAELKRHRLINSMEQFLHLNGKERLLDDDRTWAICKTVDKDGLGWVSRDGTHLTFRYLRGKHPYRFRTVCLDKFANGSKVFTIPSQVERMARRIELVMTEGYFDLWSVHQNFYKGEDTVNRVFCAVNGKGYNLFPKLLMRNGYLNIDLVIFSDSDVGKEKYMRILETEKFDSITLHYNTFEGEKDFGVRREKIRRKTINLK